MKKNMLLLSVIALSCLNLKNVSATNLIGGFTDFINEFRQEKRAEKACQEAVRAEAIDKFMKNRIDKLLDDAERMDTPADMLARAQIIEQKLCKSYPGKSIAERPYLCNMATFFTLGLKAIYDDTSATRILIHEERVAQANPELAQSIKRDPTADEFLEMTKTNDFFQGRMDQETYLKS